MADQRSRAGGPVKTSALRGRPALASLALAAVLLSHPADAPGQPELLDRIVAVVDDQTILWSELSMRVRLELQQEGRTLFVTTQYVGEAAYCDFVGVMANGRLLMVETPDGLRRRAYGGELVDLTTQERLVYKDLRSLHQLPFVTGKVSRIEDGDTVRLVVDKASTAIPALLEWCQQEYVTVESIEECLPPFDDVFVELVKDVPVHE